MKKSWPRKSNCKGKNTRKDQEKHGKTIIAFNSGISKLTMVDSLWLCCLTCATQLRHDPLNLRILEYFENKMIWIHLFGKPNGRSEIQIPKKMCWTAHIGSKFEQLHPVRHCRFRTKSILKRWMRGIPCNKNSHVSTMLQRSHWLKNRRPRVNNSEVYPEQCQVWFARQNARNMTRNDWTGLVLHPKTSYLLSYFVSLWLPTTNLFVHIAL